MLSRKTILATQLITPHPDINCTPGMCLVYVRETFGIQAKYPTATAGWKSSTHKHLNEDFPAKVWIPLSDNPDGHVVLRQPDGSIWSASSPTAGRPVHHSSIEALKKYYNNRLHYLGWTEDIEGVKVVASNAGVTQVQPLPTAPAERAERLVSAYNTSMMALLQEMQTMGLEPWHNAEDLSEVEKALSQSKKWRADHGKE